MTTSVGREAWEDFARMAGVELAVIDENTTPRQLSVSSSSARWCTSEQRTLIGGPHIAVRLLYPNGFWTLIHS